MTNAFKVGKLNQSTNTIQEYDLPTPKTIIRFIYADIDGIIWFPNNSNNDWNDNAVYAVADGDWVHF